MLPGVTCGNLTCAAPVSQSIFLTTDKSVRVWFACNGVSNGDVLSFNWIHPSGAVDSYQPSTTITFNGTGCAAWSISIAGSEPANDPGNWQVKVFRNGGILFTLPFTIVN